MPGMTITFTGRAPTPKTELGLTKALMRHFDWTKKRCYPNVHLFPWESDLLVLSASDYVTEIEIKVSLADWRSDAAKAKWRPDPYTRWTPGPNPKKSYRDHNEDAGWQYVKTFFYAVPPQLIAGLPDIPPWAGVLTVDERGQVRTHRPATMRKAIALPPEKMKSLHSSVYYRFGNQFMRKG